MKFIAFIICLGIPHLSMAQKAQVLLLDENIDEAELRQNFNVQRGSTSKSSLPDRGSRDKILSAVPAISEWDELKKDIFFMELETKTIPQLKKKYPELNESQIKTLKDKR